MLEAFQGNYARFGFLDCRPGDPGHGPMPLAPRGFEEMPGLRRRAQHTWVSGSAGFTSGLSGEQSYAGLDFPFARAIVRAHSGSIKVESELSKGPTLTVLFR